jgi:hypothetical protein
VSVCRSQAAFTTCSTGVSGGLAIERRPANASAAPICVRPTKNPLAANLSGFHVPVRVKASIEPVFADTKFNRRCDRFQRRGRAAARSEWRVIAATHNLLKLWRHTTAAQPA